MSIKDLKLSVTQVFRLTVLWLWLASVAVANHHPMTNERNALSYHMMVIGHRHGAKVTNQGARDAVLPLDGGYNYLLITTATRVERAY